MPDDAAPLPTLDREAVERRVRELGPWFHHMELAGVPTAPDHFLGDYPRVKFRGFHHALPPDMTGRSVLDIGCNAGFYAMEMKRRGAGRVVGIDSDDAYLAQARFAAEVEGFDIEFAKLDVYDVAALGETFDLVIFMGVLYHLRHPLLALDLIREYVAGDMLLYQSLQRGSKMQHEPRPDYDIKEVAMFDRGDWPKLHFVEHSYSRDWTNWFIPNRAASAAMLRSSGFEIVSNPDPEVFVCRTAARAYPASPVHPARPPAA